jgi:hypothetical protein
MPRRERLEFIGRDHLGQRNTVNIAKKPMWIDRKVATEDISVVLDDHIGATVPRVDA